MKKWKLFVGVLLVFVAGVLIGSLGSGFYHQYLFDRFRKNPAQRKAFVLRQFSERLDLTENQQKAFKAAIDQMDQQRWAQVMKNRSEQKKINDDGYARMKTVLNPDQQNAFDELLKDIRQRRKFRSVPDHPEKKKRDRR
ncbi:MAG: hypothetical protein Q8P24_08515 [Desulfobacterales bacterium]|nr:hypothetical protein [Desulfobacterales bacterium]